MGSERANSTWDAEAVFSAILPIGVLVLVSIMGSALLPLLGVKGTLANLVAMLAGLLLALIASFAGHGSNLPAGPLPLPEKRNVAMVVLVLGIQAFSAALLCPLDGAGGTSSRACGTNWSGRASPSSRSSWSSPSSPGRSPGWPSDSSGPASPSSSPSWGPIPPWPWRPRPELRLSFGYMGMMLSPMHACFVVTAEYFRTPIYGAYRYLLGPAAIMLVTAGVLSAAWYFLL